MAQNVQQALVAVERLAMAKYPHFQEARLAYTVGHLRGIIQSLASIDPTQSEKILASTIAFCDGQSEVLEKSE